MRDVLVKGDDDNYVLDEMLISIRTTTQISVVMELRVTIMRLKALAIAAAVDEVAL